jgi:tetratricopeptide (TPR) repeat protein
VNAVLSLLWASAGGVAETELMDLLDDGGPLTRVLLSKLLHAAGDLLVERAGRITIAKRELRSTVEQRYVPDDNTKAQRKLRLAQYFARRDYGLSRLEGGDPNSWRDDVMELANLYATAGAWQDLAVLLADPNFLTVACLSSREVTARHWASIEANSGIRILDTYRQTIEVPSKSGSAREVALLFADLGHQREAAKVFSGLIDRFRLPRERILEDGQSISYLFDPRFFRDDGLQSMQEQTLHVLLLDRSTIMRQLGDLDAARADIVEAERIAENWGDLSGVAHCRMQQGALAAMSGDHKSAMKLFQDASVMARKADNAEAVADVASSAGRVLFELGQIENALQVQADALAFCLKHRERPRAIGMLYNNLGMIYWRQGRKAEALHCYEESENWYRRMERDLPMNEIGRAIGSQAELLQQLERPGEAVPHFREAAKAFAAAGNRSLEQAALLEVMRHLGEAINKPSLSLAEDDRVLEEAESVVLRILDLASTDSATDADMLSGLTKNAFELLMRRGIRLQQLGRVMEARATLDRAVAVARAHGLGDAESVVAELCGSVEQKDSGSGAPLACVHCGQTDDPSLKEREHQFSVRNRGRQYFFAQCAACRVRLIQANPGYFVIRSVVGGYPEEQLRRALAPGSDELWIA